MSRCFRLILGALVASAIGAPVASSAQTSVDAPAVKVVTVATGMQLHYVDRGHGTPVVFVHGSLSDGGYWSDELGPFSEDHRVIAYSRRYNSPNTNRILPGYSAVVDADDLAALIRQLHLGAVHLVGHSYGALTALFLAVRHPELVRTLVLAEAPAISLLGHLEGERAARGRSTLADIETRMVKPMKDAFARGDREAGVRAFITYVFDDPHAWDRMSDASRTATLKNAHEWDAMMTTGELFPDLPPSAVRRIQAPTLLLSGEHSYPFLALIDEELERLLPHARRIIVRGAAHQMWMERPDVCRKAVLDFWRSSASSIRNHQKGLAPSVERTGVRLMRADAQHACVMSSIGRSTSRR